MKLKPGDTIIFKELPKVWSRWFLNEYDQARSHLTVHHFDESSRWYFFEEKTPHGATISLTEHSVIKFATRLSSCPMEET